MGKKPTGLSPSRPLFVSHVKAKVNDDLFYLTFT